MTKQNRQLDNLAALSDFVERASHGPMRKGHMFGCCVRASLAKAYELANEAHAERRNRIAFFLVPSLRSVCEDLIVLSYAAQMPKPDREQLVSLSMQREVFERLERQRDFFGTARPDQPILGPGSTDRTAVQDSIREIWKRNGWPRLADRYEPPTRQVAEKNRFDLLATLYEYLYRLTSGMVHFNPHVLLRSGWGDPPAFHFSPRNFDAYYLAFAQIYGLLLLTFYFELFGRFLRPGAEVQGIVEGIRSDLLKAPRWPEMVTHEEMNLEVPQGSHFLRTIIRASDAESLKGGILKRKPKGRPTTR